MRVSISDSETLSLSDTSSLASLEEYRGRSESQSSLSFSGQSQRLLDDDSVTVSSRDAGITPYQSTDPTSTRDRPTQSSRNSRDDDVSSFELVHPKNSPVSSNTDPFTDLSMIRSTSGYMVSRQQSDEYLSAARRFPADVSEVFENIRIQDRGRGDLVPSPDDTASAHNRSAAWLQDQNEHLIRSKLGTLPVPSTADGASVDSGRDGAPPLRRNLQGDLYYYDYQSFADSSGSSQAHDSGFEDVLSTCDGPDNVSGFEHKPRLSPENLHWVVKQQMSRSHELQPLSLQSPVMPSHNSDPLPNSRDFDHIDPETPPEVLQFVPVRPPHPSQLTDCSGCRAVLDSMRYVCKDCGEKSPIPYRMDKGKGKGTYRNSNPASHQFHQLASSSSPNISLPFVSNEFASSSYDIAQKPLPALPNRLSTPSYSIANISDYHIHRSFREGYELCAGCMVELAGVAHAIDAGESSAPFGPSSPDETSEWTRSAPKQKGQLRHSYVEKSWDHKGWMNVGTFLQQLIQIPLMLPIVIRARRHCVLDM
jgi:hypothetical protein